jgi:hypothetical protein
MKITLGLFEFFKKFAEIFTSQGTPLVSTTPAANLPPVPATPVANFTLLLTTPVANLPLIIGTNIRLLTPKSELEEKNVSIS